MSDEPRLHRYDYKLGIGWFCRWCSDLCPADTDHPSPATGCRHPCDGCAHRITNIDCPYNRRLAEHGLIEPIGNIRYADSAADPEHARDVG